MTHHPEDAEPADRVTFLDGDLAEAVRIALAAVGGKNVEVLSPDIGRQLLQRGLLDEIDLHIAPVLLGQGIRLYEHLGGGPIYLHRVGADDPTTGVSVRYRPATNWAHAGPVAATRTPCRVAPAGCRRPGCGSRMALICLSLSAYVAEAGQAWHGVGVHAADGTEVLRRDRLDDTTSCAI